MPPWPSTGYRVLGHKSFPTHTICSVSKQRGSFCHFHQVEDAVTPPHQHTCHSRINSSHAPRTLTQHSQTLAGISTPPSPVNLRSPHLPPAQAITKSVTGRQGHFITSCHFPANYKRGHSKKTLQQLCQALHNFAGPHQALKAVLTHFGTAIFAACAGDC